MIREVSDLEYAARRALKYMRGPFLAEQLLAYALKYLDDGAFDKRRFGPVMQALARDKVIDFHGYAPAKTSHRSPKTLWRKL